MDFVAVMDQVIALLHQRGRLTYRTLRGSSSSTRWRWSTEGGTHLRPAPEGSMALLADRDPEEAHQSLDPVLEHMMAAVHCYAGKVCYTEENVHA